MSEHADEQHSYRAQGPATPSVGRIEASLFELSVDQSRLLDELSVERYGIPSILLMENAALGLMQHVRAMLDSCSEPSALVVAGPGNNGGDGFALARHLHNASIQTRVVIVQSIETYSGDAGLNLDVIRRMGLEIIEALEFLHQEQPNQEPLLIDALFGTGLSRAIEGLPAKLITWMNRARQNRGCTGAERRLSQRARCAARQADRQPCCPRRSHDHVRGAQARGCHAWKRWTTSERSMSLRSERLSSCSENWVGHLSLDIADVITTRISYLGRGPRGESFRSSLITRTPSFRSPSNRRLSLKPLTSIV